MSETVKHTPIHYFLRLYAAMKDIAPEPSSDVTDSPYWAALRTRSSMPLAALITEVEAVLEKMNESEIRDMLQDGHTYFAWRNPDSATQFLKRLLADAKSLTAD